MVGTPSMKIKGQNINQDDKKQMNQTYRGENFSNFPKFETNKMSQQELNELKTMTNICFMQTQQMF